MSRTWKKPALAQREPRPDPKGGHINIFREAEEDLEDFENLEILLEDADDDE